MKVVAINGSPNAEGNTSFSLKKVIEALEDAGIETEMLQIGAASIPGCTGCGACATGDCVLADEDFLEWTQKLYEADGILIGSPVYYTSIAGNLRCFLDRAFFQAKGRMRGKVGAGVAVCRRAGAVTTFEQINAYFLISEMFVAPSSYWNVAFGAAPGEVLQDAEGMNTLSVLGQNMAWFLKVKEATKDSLPFPEKSTKIATNFIR